MSLSAHQSARMMTDEWLTPPEILAALGPFDLDPCTPDAMPWQTAAARYTKRDDGLAQPWRGRVWLNPPFGREAVRWLRKLAAHGDGDSAWEELQQKSFDLLLTDIVMPGLDGIELARRGAEADPSMKIVFITGFAAVALSAQSQAPKDAKVLSKPFHLKDLVVEIERVIAAA